MGKPRGGDRERPRAAHGEGGGIVAGDRRRLVNGESEGLLGLGRDSVGRGNAQSIGAATATGGRPAEGRRAIAVVEEGDAAGQGAALAQASGREAGGRDREGPALPTVKVVASSLVIGGSLIDREGEGLLGFGGDAVRRGEAQRIGAAASARGRPAEGRRAVPVVEEGDAAGQGAALAQASGRGSRWW